MSWRWRAVWWAGAMAVPARPLLLGFACHVGAHSLLDVCGAASKRPAGLPSRRATCHHYRPPSHCSALYAPATLPTPTRRGYSIGQRLIDEFLAKSKTQRCSDFREVAGEQMWRAIVYGCHLFVCR